MAKERNKPTATVTLKSALTLRRGKTLLRKNQPTIVSGESNIQAFENDNRVIVRRNSEIHKEEVAKRKSKKTKKKAVKNKVDVNEDEDE